MAIRMGFEGILKVGAATVQADTAVTDAKDITLTFDLERGDTTVRGASTTVPFKTELATLQSVTIEWTMLYNNDAEPFEEIRTAVETGAALAVYLIPETGGEGPDFDATISAAWPMPLNGEQSVTFTAVPSLWRGASL